MDLPHQILHSAIHHPTLRAWQSGPNVTAECLVYPLFVSDQPALIEEIPSMPLQKRYGINQLEAALKPLVENGLKTILLFGVVSNNLKDEKGTFADHDDSPAIKAIQLCKKNFPDLLIACDVCLCPYTSHGHCGILYEDATINNAASIQRLAEISLKYAQAGANVIAPSDMMDGRIKAIKSILYENNLSHRVAVMSYSAKFASAFYGPFRDAAQSSPSFGDRKCYQLPHGSTKLAQRAMIRDVEEGADILMVKPGFPYLDIIQKCHTQFPNHPMAVYQVSGEYSMLYHAAVTHQLVDLKQGVMECLEAYLRAGCSIIITYWTPVVLEWLKDNKP